MVVEDLLNVRVEDRDVLYLRTGRRVGVGVKGETGGAVLNERADQRDRGDRGAEGVWPNQERVGAVLGRRVDHRHVGAPRVNVVANDAFVRLDVDVLGPPVLVVAEALPAPRHVDVAQVHVQAELHANADDQGGGHRVRGGIVPIARSDIGRVFRTDDGEVLDVRPGNLSGVAQAGGA